MYSTYSMQLHPPAIWTEPLARGYPGEWGIQALQVIGEVTAVTQQQTVLAIT